MRLKADDCVADVMEQCGYPRAACPFCKKEPAPDAFMYLVNARGGYGLPEMYACDACMRAAEPGSKLAELRDGLYAEDFAA